MKKTPIKWHIEQWKIADLKDAGYNPRDMTEQEERDLTESVKRFGMAIPGVINIGSRNGVLIGGHQRKKIAVKNGESEMAVMVPDRELTENEEKEANLRFNKNTGHFVFEKLKDMDLGMLLDVGFGDEELSSLWDDVDVIDDNFNLERAIKKVKEPRIKLGEIYELGDHRLMCGDSTDPEQVKKLMGEDLADVVYCDPPYNIGLDYSKGLTTKGKYQGSFTGKKDSKSNEKYTEFIDTTLENALLVSKPNNHVFYWCDEKYIGLVQWVFGVNKVESRRVCLWIKSGSGFGMTPQVAFNKVYEPCVYGTRGKPYLNKALTNLTEIMNKEVGTGNQMHEDILEIINLWVVRRDNPNDYSHPTQKPVTLAERPLKRCSGPGHTVIDLFGGSGSTLIACEQIKRKARLMEQDPVFATVILDRWEQFSNQKAKKI